jgi:hypothetical protein
MSVDRDNRPGHSPETPPEFRNLHRALFVVAAFFFIYLVVEAIVMMPYFIVHFGWQ